MVKTFEDVAATFYLSNDHREQKFFYNWQKSHTQMMMISRLDITQIILVMLIYINSMKKIEEE